MRWLLAAALAVFPLTAPLTANAQEVDSGGDGGGGFGGPRGGFVDNPLKRYPTPFPTTPWFGLGSPQVPSGANASADSPIAAFALSFEELEALLRGEPLFQPRQQQLEDINTLLGRNVASP